MHALCRRQCPAVSFCKMTALPVPTCPFTRSYLGLFEAERDAATAYDRSLVRLRGGAAATNFSLSEYAEELAEYHTAQQVGGTKY